jgi:hypothetical protein
MDQHQTSEAAGSAIHVSIKLHDNLFFDDRENYDRQTEGNLTVRPLL